MSLLEGRKSRRLIASLLLQVDTGVQKYLRRVKLDVYGMC